MFFANGGFEVQHSPAPGGARRLLLLSTNMGVGGGAEEQVIRLAYGFKDRGWETRIVSMLPPMIMPDGFEQHGIPLEHLGMRSGIPDPRGIRRLVRRIRDFQPHVVHAHMTHANLLARAVRLIQPYPVLVCTLHNLTMAGVKRDWTGVFEAAHRFTDPLSNQTTAICHAASQYYIRRRAVPPSKMLVVSNGIDTRAYHPDLHARQRLRSELGVDDRFVFLAVGRLELQKAYPTMLRAFAGLGRDNLLLVCGAGSLKDDLEALAVDLCCHDRVRFLGHRADIPALMSAADAFAMSSDMEGLPLVLLQASAAALPIVATDVGGNAEIVVDGVTGRLVPPGDPAALARELARMAALPRADRLAMGHAAQQRVQTLFEAERIIDHWEQLFTRLLSAARGASRFHRCPEPAEAAERPVAATATTDGLVYKGFSQPNPRSLG